MHRQCFAMIAAVLLLFPVSSLVSSFMTSAQPSSHGPALEPVSPANGEGEQRDVELDMMRFTPSASPEDGIHYVARRGVDAIAYFGESEVYYVLGNTLVLLEFPGSMSVIPLGEEPTGSITNYIYGNDPNRWRTGLNDCSVLRYASIYPGIDLVYKSLDGNLKYEFVVAPYADPSLIRLRYPDADSVDVFDEAVTVSKDRFTFADTGLLAFQEGPRVGGVECAFRALAQRTIALFIGRYEVSCELIVDPVILTYSTFLGGSTRGHAIAVENGCVYVTGYTYATNFPTVNPFDSTFNGNAECFVTKLATDGRSLVYSTFLGGESDDVGYGIAVENGCIYVTGETYSSGFPTVNAFDSTHSVDSDCFVTKFAADGQSLVYSTFLGSASIGRGIAADNGSAYVTGSTVSSDFPTVNAYNSTYSGGWDCFVTKFAVDGQSLAYSTFLGGSGEEVGMGVAVENGSAYVTGYTYSPDFPTANAYDSNLDGATGCFVTRLAPNGQFLVYSTFLGGISYDLGYAIAVEDGFAYVTGNTQSFDFPTANAFDPIFNGAQDCFVTKLAVDGQSLAYSTFLGDTASERGQGIAVESGFAYITGLTDSSAFPTVNAFDSAYNGGYDCFVTMLAVDCRSPVYSTFLGSASNDIGYGIAVENGSAYVTGYTLSAAFPTINAYDRTLNGGEDCFIAMISDDIDSDMDGLTDREEDYYGTDRFCIDSDNDNFLDGYEAIYGSDPMDPMSYPGMPQAWYDAIYDDLDGNATLIQQVISWLDGNHTAIETLFFYLDGNATLLIQTVNVVNANSSQLDLLAALVTQDIDALSSLNATHIGDIGQIRAVLDMLGVTVGDTDYDGLDDLDEIALGTDIRCIDTDCDNLNDAYEVKIGTDPTDDDSDNDTYYDGAEVLAGTDPLDALDYPGNTSTTTEHAMGTEVIIIAGAAGCVGIIALLVVMRRRAGIKASS